MESNGFVKLFRNSLESSLFSNANLWKVWCYCLLRANYKQRTILFETEEITLSPGQFITGRLQGAMDCDMQPSTYRNQLKKLQSLTKLDIKSDNKKSIITILNWGSYQDASYGVDSTSDSKRTAKGQQEDTDKNSRTVELKEINNVHSDFNRFWNLYDKKINKTKCYQLWTMLIDDEKENIFAVLPEYIKCTPDKLYRKHPLTFLRNKSWEDEIIKGNKNGIGNIKSNHSYSRPKESKFNYN